MKTYVITLAKTFPKGHPKAGENTDFRKKVSRALARGCAVCVEKLFDHGCEYSRCNSCEIVEEDILDKIHSVRTNTALWIKRIKEVQRGNACLSIREWSGRPYLSKQITISDLYEDNEVGIQILNGEDVRTQSKICKVYDLQGVRPVSAKELAIKDGLSLDDWRAWFGRHTKGDFAIIHFTAFRY